MSKPLIANSSPIENPAGTAANEWRWADRIALLLTTPLFVVVLAMKVVCALKYRVNSDEPQHLHVVWGWANGLVQYRDIFDNHCPLFQMLYAPVFRLFGERADIILPMRMTMLPLFAACIWCAYRIAAALYSRRAGLWTALIAAAMPGFFLTSTEFRTDNLWAVLWLFALLVLLSGTLTPKRAFLFGLVIGAAFGVSGKTSLLCVTLLLAAIVVLLLRCFAGGARIEWRRLLSCVPAAIGGMVIIPGALVLLFVALGAWRQMYYCVVGHNILPGYIRAGPLRAYGERLLYALPVVCGIGWLIIRFSANAGLGARRALVVLWAAFYLTALWRYWPDITKEDYLPFYPVLALAAAPLLFVPEWKRFRWRYGVVAGQALALIAAMVEILWMKDSGYLRHDRTAKDIRPVATVLRLTKPGEYVMDLKGDAIFRPRPYYYVLEPFTKQRIRMGWIRDDIPERLVATRTAVVFAGSGVIGFGGALPFIAANYILLRESEGRLEVPGKLLTKDAAAASPAPISFDVAIPARYVIVAPDHLVAGVLDGTPFFGARFLEAGAHEFRPTAGQRAPLALFWTNAYEKGYLPSFSEGSDGKRGND